MKTMNVKVKGMTCENCVKHVREKLESIDGVSNVNVGLDGGGKTSFDYDESKTDMDSIKKEIKDLGYNMKTGLFG